jgi:capsid protein
MEAAAVMGAAGTVEVKADGEVVYPRALWTAPPLPMIDPANEGLAVQRNIRTGITSLSESIRERGLDPDELLKEIAKDNESLDKLGIILDSDARLRTQAGLAQATAGAPGGMPGQEPPPAAAPDGGEGGDKETPPPGAKTKGKANGKAAQA